MLVVIETPITVQIDRIFFYVTQHNAAGQKKLRPTLYVTKKDISASHVKTRKLNILGGV